MIIDNLLRVTGGWFADVVDGAAAGVNGFLTSENLGTFGDINLDLRKKGTQKTNNQPEVGGWLIATHLWQNWRWFIVSGSYRRLPHQSTILSTSSREDLSDSRTFDAGLSSLEPSKPSKRSGANM